MSNYLVELSVIHIALLLGYGFFLRKERQYAKMRFYLIGATLLALTIPLLKLPNLFYVNQEPIAALPMEAISLNATTITPIADRSVWDYDLLIWTYGAISALFLLKFFNNMLYLVYLGRKSSREKFNDMSIRKVANMKGSFTFFHWIFLSDEIDNKGPDYAIILKHEKGHASLGHTYDILFFELFKVCFWWLPTTWFIIQEIKKIHEFQADAYALRSYTMDQYSSILISSTLKSHGLNLVSSFHDGLILKRLLAMKQQTKKVSPWKLGLLSALCSLLFVVFACSEEQEPKSKELGSQSNQSERAVLTVVEEQPEFAGGMNAYYGYVAKEIKYPLSARQMGVEGRVDVQFVIEKDGSLSDIKVIKGIGAGCDDEAVRVVQNAPSFQPGTQGGKPVRVRLVLPIIFQLNEGKRNEDNSTPGKIMVEEVESSQGRLRVDANYAQDAWSGTVYDPEGEKLPGVNIVVVGTTTGTVSDINGHFKVKAHEANDLSLSFIGYESLRLEGK
ncbi:TonB family protein [Adhaeribacter radiodurans]|uniref:TonB family protein n=1 Tax=Adhaeribacter radiodurans TaxID=2745197 RepID=A0A7L7L8C7_9BACT|nr:TonB family protein [Adhaeribacter radiodurans]QMU28795.1 TonB family protein [Adhaeribacter radiodurans]